MRIASHCLRHSKMGLKQSRYINVSALQTNWKCNHHSPNNHSRNPSPNNHSPNNPSNRNRSNRNPSNRNPSNRNPSPRNARLSRLNCCMPKNSCRPRMVA